jgi:hypothetical protein
MTPKLQLLLHRMSAVIGYACDCNYIFSARRFLDPHVQSEPRFFDEAISRYVL